MIDSNLKGASAFLDLRELDTTVSWIICEIFLNGPRTSLKERQIAQSEYRLQLLRGECS